MKINGSLTSRIRKIISIHFDPNRGTPFWLDRAQELEIDPIHDIWSKEDLDRLGPMTQSQLCERPLIDYIPRMFHDRLDQFIIGQTGGTTNQAVWTAYRNDEFNLAFILPFVHAARHVNFQSHDSWLFVGPSGPHIIGKVVRHLAVSLGAHDPFSVDFDPRWAKKMKPGSLAGKRYLQHVIEQAMAVIRSQKIGVLFTTPVVLVELVKQMTQAQRLNIKAVHYGGMSITPVQLLKFQTQHFTNAVHLSGYGNTLFGCCLEHDVTPGRQLQYDSNSSRLILEVLDDELQPCDSGETGQVYFTRLDESMLIVRLKERDEAEATALENCPDLKYIKTSVMNPRPMMKQQTSQTIGLY